MSNNTQPDITAQRPRYELLDGLRGVAAVLVIWYHFFEGFATSAVDQMINHGYLAVDFFFVLSGFVLGYAYDAPMRSHRLSTGSFIVRRIIRLQPLVVLSVLLGAAAYLLQGSVRWDGTPVPLHQVLTALLLGLFMIPVLPGAGAEVRGNGEMFPLNGPGWSLFFEYIGSIIYATVLYRLGRRALACITVAAALCLAYTAFGNMSGAYHLGVGWSMADYGFWGGFSRLVFSFSAGLLIQRCVKPRHIKGAFWLCSALLCAILTCPYVGSSTEPSVFNALYDIVCTIFFFPAIVWLGACGTTTDRTSTRLCNFLGSISYPVYIVHYPVMYLFYAWVWAGNRNFAEVWPVCAGLFVLIIFMAWCAMRFYDTPVRRYLTERLKKERTT